MALFLVRLPDGGEFLFQARDDEEMNHWVRGIDKLSQEAAGAGPSRAQTLPASSAEKKDEPKKRGFFTLKKK
jgi:spectrin beta